MNNSAKELIDSTLEIDSHLEMIAKIDASFARLRKELNLNPSKAIGPLDLDDQAIRAKLLRIFDIGEKIGAYTQLNKPVSWEQIREENRHLLDERVIIVEEVVNLISHRGTT